MKSVVFITLIFGVLSYPVFAESSHNHTSHFAVEGNAQSRGQVTKPIESGQSAFASIQEIASILLSDPKTDWSKVDLEKLRAHLFDMDNVTLRSDVTTEKIANGAKFTVTASHSKLIRSIKNMTLAHSIEISGTFGWVLSVEDLPDGAVLTVTGRPKDTNKILGLGFTGIMTLGMHHQTHHLAIARGEKPH